jgi:hypothetical protein
LPGNRKFAFSRSFKRIASPRLINNNNLTCFSLENSINVHLNMSEWENGQLPRKRTVRSRISSEQRDQIKTAYASGIGLREIARNMNIPEGTVLARAKREAWTREIQSAKALAKREDSAPRCHSNGSRRNHHAAAR